MLLNQLLFNRRPAHMHTHTHTHTHLHICKASISRGNNKNNGSSSSLNIFALFPFGFCKTSALQSCHNFAAPPPLPLSRWHLLLPLLVSQRKCLLVELHKKKKKKTNAERRQLLRQQQFQVLRQSPDWLSLWGVYLSASCWQRHAVTFVPLPFSPCPSPFSPAAHTKLVNQFLSAFFGFAPEWKGKRERNALGNVWQSLCSWTTFISAAQGQP